MLSRADKAKALRLAYRDCFATDHGKAVLLDMMQRYSFYTPSHIPGDPYTSAYNSGQTSVVQFIVTQISDTQLPERFIDARTQIERDHDPLSGE